MFAPYGQKGHLRASKLAGQILRGIFCALHATTHGCHSDRILINANTHEEYLGRISINTWLSLNKTDQQIQPESIISNLDWNRKFKMHNKNTNTQCWGYGWMWWGQIGVLACSQLVKSASWRTHKASFSSLIAEGVEGGSSQLIRIVGLRQDKEQPGKPPGPNLPLLNHPSSSAFLSSVLPSSGSQTAPGAPPPWI